MEQRIKLKQTDRDYLGGGGGGGGGTVIITNSINKTVLLPFCEN